MFTRYYKPAARITMNSIVNLFVIFLILSDVQFLLASDSITRPSDIILTGNERISKRSLSEDDVEDVATILTRSDKKRSLEVDPPVVPEVKVRDDFIPNESSAPKQVVGNSYRVGRAKKGDGEDSDKDGVDADSDHAVNGRQIRSAVTKGSEDLEDLDTAANIVFMPSFRKRNGIRRFRRSADLKEASQNADNLDDLDTAANIVLMPSFRRRSGIRRFRRSADFKGDTSINADNLDLETAANIVFMPSFRRHSGVRRFRRSAAVSINPNNLEDLKTAANIVFIPSFSKRFRRFTNVKEEASQNSDNLEDLDTAANMVFMPSFKRRNSFRRLKRSPIQQDTVSMPNLRRHNGFILKRSPAEPEEGFTQKGDLEDLDNAAYIDFMKSSKRQSDFRRFKRSSNQQEKEIEADLDMAFRRRSGFGRFKRSSYQKSSAQMEDDLADLDTAAFVFMPSFKRNNGFRRLARV